MSKNPMGPYEYKGLIMAEHANGCWTNHHSIINYQGQWYLFYHHNEYSPNDDKRRSVCIDSLFFNPDGTIQEVKPTLRGVGISDATQKIQIDRYSAISKNADIQYLDTTNYFKGWATNFQKGSWVRYNKVDFSKVGSQATLMVKADGKATLSIRVGSADAKPIAVAKIKRSTPWTLVNVKTKALPKGVADLFVTCDDGAASVDWVQFK
jgi:hypothetical protein